MLKLTRKPVRVSGQVILGHGQEASKMFFDSFFLFPSVSPFRIQGSPLPVGPGSLNGQEVLRKKKNHLKYVNTTMLGQQRYSDDASLKEISF